MIDYLEIKLIQLTIWTLKRGYGEERCEGLDLDDFPELKEDERCPICRAYEIITWLEGHIDLIKM